MNKSILFPKHRDCIKHGGCSYQLIEDTIEKTVWCCRRCKVDDTLLKESEL